MNINFGLSLYKNHIKNIQNDLISRSMYHLSMLRKKQNVLKH